MTIWSRNCTINQTSSHILSQLSSNFNHFDSKFGVWICLCLHFFEGRRGLKKVCLYTYETVDNYEWILMGNLIKYLWNGVIFNQFLSIFIKLHVINNYPCICNLWKYFSCHWIYSRFKCFFHVFIKHINNFDYEFI